MTTAPFVRRAPALTMAYVPQGLTEAQYQAIKQRDADRIRSSDFGAWGPRFRRQSAPFWADKKFLSGHGALVSGGSDSQESADNLVNRLCRSLNLLAAALLGLLRRRAAFAANAVVVRLARTVVACRTLLDRQKAP